MIKWTAVDVKPIPLETDGKVLVRYTSKHWRDTVFHEVFLVNEGYMFYEHTYDEVVVEDITITHWAPVNEP